MSHMPRIAGLVIRDRTMTSWRRGTAAATAATALALVAVAGAAPSASPTADQRFVAALAGARTATKSAMRQLKATPTIDNVTRAKADVTVAQEKLRTSSSVLRATVGGAQSEGVVTSLQIAATQTSQAAAAVKKSSYNAARVNLGLAVDAETGALTSFGAPLANDFRAVAAYRDLTKIEGWEGYVGLTAKAAVPITKIVIGIAGRETASVGEPGGMRQPPQIPITKVAIYTLQQPSGEYSSGWCRLVNGILVCKLNRTMAADESFAVSFGPLVPAGTQFLVKFWSDHGKRSHAIMTTR